MKNVSRANTYFLVILLLQLFFPIYSIFKIFNITDIRLMLFLSHTITFIIPAIIYLIVTKQSPRDVLKLNKLYFKDSMLLIVLAFICQPIMTFFSLISQFFFENEVATFFGQIIETPYIVLLLLMAVLPAITEEITIRGVVLSGYKNKNIYLSAIMTGLLFGIMHLDPQQFLYATALGFIFAIVVRITNSIFAASLMHFLINGTSVTLQKLISFVPQNGDIMEQASEISLKSMPLIMKLYTGAFYGSIAIAFGIVAFFILKKVADMNIRRGIIKRQDISIKYNVEKENIFDLQFIAIIIIYLLYMIRAI